MPDAGIQATGNTQTNQGPAGSAIAHKMRKPQFPYLVIAIFLQLQTKPILTSQIFESKPQLPSASAASTRGSFSPDLHLRSRRRRLADSESQSDNENDKEVDEIALAKLFLGPKANRTRNYGVDIDYCRPQNEWFTSWPENDILPGEPGELS